MHLVPDSDGIWPAHQHQHSLSIQHLLGDSARIPTMVLCLETLLHHLTLAL